jgi:hypothetical protein
MTYHSSNADIAHFSLKTTQNLYISQAVDKNRKEDPIYQEYLNRAQLFLVLKVSP